MIAVAQTGLAQPPGRRERRPLPGKTTITVDLGRLEDRLLWWFRHPFSQDLEACAETNS